MIRFSFPNPVNGYIELDSVSMEQVVYRRWSIEPHKEPLRVIKLMCIILFMIILFICC